jgi:hypothetical protein
VHTPDFLLVFVDDLPEHVDYALHHLLVCFSLDREPEPLELFVCHLNDALVFREHLLRQLPRILDLGDL